MCAAPSLSPVGPRRTAGHERPLRATRNRLRRPAARRYLRRANAAPVDANAAQHATASHVPNAIQSMASPQGSAILLDHCSYSVPNFCGSRAAGLGQTAGWELGIGNWQHFHIGNIQQGRPLAFVVARKRPKPACARPPRRGKHKIKTSCPELTASSGSKRKFIR